MLSEDQVGRSAGDGCQPTDGRRVSYTQAHKFTQHVVPLCSILGSCAWVLFNKKKGYTSCAPLLDIWLPCHQHLIIFKSSLKKEKRRSFSPSSQLNYCPTSLPLSQPNYSKELFTFIDSIPLTTPTRLLSLNSTPAALAMITNNLCFSKPNRYFLVSVL